MEPAACRRPLRRFLPRPFSNTIVTFVTLHPRRLTRSPAGKPARTRDGDQNRWRDARCRECRARAIPAGVPRRAGPHGVSVRSSRAAQSRGIFQRGERLSRNAAMPSFASSDARSLASKSAVNGSASAGDIEATSLTRLFAAASAPGAPCEMAAITRSTPASRSASAVTSSTRPSSWALDALIFSPVRNSLRAWATPSLQCRAAASGHWKLGRGARAFPRFRIG